jgi:sulfite reductase (ferredoxin)
MIPALSPKCFSKQGFVMSAEQPGATPSQPARSAVEVQKENSRFLRGSLADDLAKEVDHFGDADKSLLKFHGTYQQEDRDARKARKPGGLGKHYMFMVRCKIPGGRVTAAQYLGLDELTERYANGTLRITSRQGIQFHGVLMTNLKATIAGINETLLTTLGACGDVNRNVMACPAPHRHDGVREQLQATAAQLAQHFAPHTNAYHEIWLNGVRNAECGMRNRRPTFRIPNSALRISSTASGATTPAASTFQSTSCRQRTPAGSLSAA